LETNLGFDEFSKWFESEVGIHLTLEKWNLVQTRIGNRLRERDAQNFKNYLQILKNDPEEMKICIESLTTHKTEWFREMVHFRWLKTVLQNKLSNQERVQIWSAACSTGPEIYSIMFLCLRVGLDPSQFRILGTDLSERAIQEASGIPEGDHFAHHWQKLKQISPPNWKVDELVRRALRESIKIRQFNLVSDQLPERVLFDAIFLRNVMIYFTRERMVEVCQKLTRHLQPNGHLVLGLSESLNQMIPELVTEGNSIYRREGGLISESSVEVEAPQKSEVHRRRKKPAHIEIKDFDLVAIGSSTGGTEIVKLLLEGFPKDCPPIVVVQHMPGNFTEAFANRLQQQTGRPTVELRTPSELMWGHAYIAAGGTHLTVEKRGTSFFGVPMDGPPVNRFKPSVSQLFDSMDDLMIASRSIAIMLTGMGSDGAREMLRLRELGALTLGQSEESCAVYGMPRAAADLGALQIQTSPEEMVEIFATQAA